MVRVVDMVSTPPSNRAGAIVTGGDYRGLAVVRSLGRQGIPVWVVIDQHQIAGFSRYCRRRLAWPSEKESDRVKYLLDTAERHGLRDWMLFPTADVTASLIARHHEALSSTFVLTTPPWEKLRLAYDKRAIHEMATRLEIDQPWTRLPKCRGEVAAMDCSFPVILKPAVKEGGFNAFVHAKAWRVNSREELLASYDQACGMVDPETIMVQELIPGGVSADFSFGALCREGEPLASITTWRARQYPIEFGRASTYVETIELPEVEEPARRLLKEMRFTGIIEVAFLKDPRDGRYKLLDVNPRAWGWHALGSRAGVDLIYQLWRLTRGEPVQGGRARTGVKWMRLLTDGPTVAKMFSRGVLSPGEYLRSWSGPREFAIFAADDPLPAVVDVPLLLKLALKRGSL
jgi:D-aspartate ligase